MASVTALVAPGSDNPDGALSEFISYARDVIKIYEDQGGFSVDQWTYMDVHGRKHAMRFAVWSKRNNPYGFISFQEPFLSFAKGYVRFHQEQHEVTSIGNKTAMLAAVYDGLSHLGRSFDILALDGAVVVKAEEFIRERYAVARQYHLGEQLEMLGDFVRSRGICPSLPLYKNPFPRQRYRAQGTTVEDKAWQEERCPSLHQMLALADIFRQSSEEKDLYWSSIIVLLMFAPSRGSELSSLMVDSLVEEDGQWYVLWFPKKKSEWTKKAVDPHLVPAVKEAFARLVRIGAAARAAAKFSYDNPGVFMRHAGCITPAGFGEEEPLTALQFAAAMNIGGSILEQSTNTMTQRMDVDTDALWRKLGVHSVKWIAKLLATGPVTYRKLADHVADQYRTVGWPTVPKSHRPVWESLTIVQDNQFHESISCKAFSWVIPSINQLNDQLAGRAGALGNGGGFRIHSIFERFGIADEDGESPIRLTSHQLRVWLSTWASRGGMSAWQLAQWAGRARTDDNKAYDCRTEREKSEQVKAVLGLAKHPAALQAVKLNLPVTYEVLGIDRPGVAHATLYGYCVRDWAMAPCLKGGGEACASCDEHKCIKGLDDRLENLVALEEGLTKELKRAAEQLDAQTFGADQWFRFLGFRLAKIRTLIALQRQSDTPVGAVLGVPQGFDPSPLQRARMQKLPKASAECERSMLSIEKKLLG